MNSNNWIPNQGSEPTRDTIDWSAKELSTKSSVGSTTQTAQPSGGDWQEEVYQKLQTMKENYMPDLNEILQEIATRLQKYDSTPQQPKSDQIEKLKVYRMVLERMISLLQVPKNSIRLSLKERLEAYEKQIVNVINLLRTREGISSLQPGQLPPTHRSSMPQSQSQVTSVQSHENQIISQMQPSNLQDSAKPVPEFSSSSATNVGKHTRDAAAPAQSLSIGTHGISALPLLAEFSGLDGAYFNAFTATSGKDFGKEFGKELLKEISSKKIEKLKKEVESVTMMKLLILVLICFWVLCVLFYKCM
ncbi:unnamed protein product [Vicia faba]|uniref:Mediator of RNA polymerase II transcription subunit 15a n=1 Tax=Vicia faba TaxID=3906 RepID=A0AAV0ZW01_VICFA|nr:unnamed protein product [Vicia faba]